MTISELIIVCRLDGEIYLEGEELPTSEACEVCICKPPGFACNVIECEYHPHCTALERSGLCCPEFRCGKHSLLYSIMTK